MNEQKIFTAIISNSFTRADLNRRLSFLRRYEEQLVFSPGNNLSLPEFLKKEGALKNDVDSMSNWDKEFCHLFNKNSLYPLLKNLEEALNSLPLINVYLPYTPNEAEVTRLGNWFRKTLQTNVIMDIKIDEKLLGGCAFVWKEKYYQFDLHFFIKKNKKALLNIFEEYAKK